MLFNPIALRKAKIAYNFGLSERNRVNMRGRIFSSWNIINDYTNLKAPFLYQHELFYGEVSLQASVHNFITVNGCD